MNRNRSIAGLQHPRVAGIGVIEKYHFVVLPVPVRDQRPENKCCRGLVGSCDCDVNRHGHAGRTHRLYSGQIPDPNIHYIVVHFPRTAVTPSIYMAYSYHLASFECAALR